MVYSPDLAYQNYFKCAAAGKYDYGIVKDRLKVTAMAAGTTGAAAFRLAGRVINLIVEIAKVAFYAMACLFTLGKFDHAKRLKDHCTLLVLNTAGLVAQSVQLAVHSLAIFIGVASPKAAHRMMQYGTTPLAWVTSREAMVWQGYKVPEVYQKVSNFIKGKILNLFKKCSWVVKSAMKTIIYEFPSAINAGAVAPLGFMDRFHLFSANPTTLTDEQRKMTPILLLNGNHSNQATFLPLLHALKKSGNKRPVYTVNLPPNLYNTEYTVPKIKKIMEQYGHSGKPPFVIDLIGHSMGSNAIQCIANAFEFRNLDENFRIGRAITLGTPWNSYFPDRLDKIFDVTGKYDRLSKSGSGLQDKSRVAVIDTGHCGLVSHPESLKKILEFLQR